MNKKLDTSSLRNTYKGEIITPEDEAYGKVCDTPFFKGKPAVIFRPKDAQDVALSIKFARDNSLETAIRSGGHSGAGFSTNNGGVVIDLSLINETKVIDGPNRIVQIGAGATWGNAARALHRHGLAISSGDTLSVGVGGLTLGGGIGWMVRKYGLAIDNLVAADVVTANGELVRASKDENPDLLWALEGGGGNFGVVTAFEFVAQPVRKVFFGNIVYGLDNLAELIAGWRDGMRKAPEELTTMLVTLPSFMGMPPAAIVMCCYAGDDQAAADKALKPFRELGKVLSDDVTLKEYFEVLQEAHPPQGMYGIVKNGFVKDLDDKLIQTIAGSYSGEAGPILQIRSLGGAMNQVAADETAFAHRDYEALIICPTFVPLEATPEMKANALGVWNKIAAFTDGGYINFFSEHDENIYRMYPKPTYNRLAAVKKSYDPQNFFSQNFNIKPNS